jgi:hypothetical protein
MVALARLGQIVLKWLGKVRLSEVAIASNSYRIYSRISQEILDKNKAKFYQFDLYAGQHLLLQKHIYTLNLCVLMQFKTLQQKFNYLILVKFLNIFFQFDLYAGRLICTRVCGTCHLKSQNLNVTVEEKSGE